MKIYIYIFRSGRHLCDENLSNIFDEQSTITTFIERERLLFSLTTLIDLLRSNPIGSLSLSLSRKSVITFLNIFSDF